MLYILRLSMYISFVSHNQEISIGIIIDKLINIGVSHPLINMLSSYFSKSPIIKIQLLGMSCLVVVEYYVSYVAVCRSYKFYDAGYPLSYDCLHTMRPGGIIFFIRCQCQKYLKLQSLDSYCNHSFIYTTQSIISCSGCVPLLRHRITVFSRLFWWCSDTCTVSLHDQSGELPYGYILFLLDCCFIQSCSFVIKFVYNFIHFRISCNKHAAMLLPWRGRGGEPPYRVECNYPLAFLLECCLLRLCHLLQSFMTNRVCNFIHLGTLCHNG